MVLVIQHAMRMRRIILSSVASLAVQYISMLSRKQRDFRKEKKSDWKRNVYFDFLHNFCLK